MNTYQTDIIVILVRRTVKNRSKLDGGLFLGYAQACFLHCGLIVFRPKGRIRLNRKRLRHRLGIRYSPLYQAYVLQSIKTGRLYIGSTADIEQRLIAHHRGDVSSTKAYRPYKIVRVEIFDSRTDARKREIQIKKSGRLRKELKQFVALKESGPVEASSSNG